MAFSEFELKRYETAARQFVESRRPPPHLRNKVDLACRISGQSLEIFEIRPIWDDPEKKIEEAVAKATYVKKRRVEDVLAACRSTVASVRSFTRGWQFGGGSENRR